MSTGDNSETINDLRARLFAVMDGVKDGSIALDAARVIVDLGHVMVNSAKAENEFLRLAERTESQFLGSVDPSRQPRLENGIVAVRRHLIKDD